MTPITIRGLRKTFGTPANPTHAVDGIDLDIPPGDLFFLLGPSGCGKTTLLRMIAGFTDPTEGTLHFGDDDVTHLAPNKRDTGMVFQGYALWPHMTVRQNVAFGLEVRKVTKDEMAKRVDDALANVQLTVQADRKINQLSGGQQQRVALARALVVKPRVLLLDEPLSNLDAKLRLEMRQSIRDICKSSGITGVYVTHDQHEALSMADGIAVLQHGKVMQSGPPRDLYARPANRFVADFLGETNFVPAEVKGTQDQDGTPTVTLETAFGTLHSTAFDSDLPVGGNVTCSIRPEALHLQPGEPNGQPNSFTADLHRTIYLGSLAQYQLSLKGTPPTPNGDTDAPTSGPMKAFELNPTILDTPDHALHATIKPDDVVILHD
ncbi:MAG: ABC transporter ATP-binding protein [Planctomycetota bacterium]